jgi:hypothetical protein
MSLKNPVTRPGIDPGTFRLVAQRLNHYAPPLKECRVSYVEIVYQLFKVACNNIKNDVSPHWSLNTNVRVECL